MLDRRVTYKRKQAYRTRSNRFRTIKTPGGKLAIKYIQKKTNGVNLPGIKVARPHDFSKIKSQHRRVNRPYGGKLSHTEVKDRITRAFLIEEINSVKNNAAQSEKAKKKKKGAKKSKK